MALTGENYRIVNPMIGYAPATYNTSYPVYEYNGRKFRNIESANDQQGKLLANGNKIKGHSLYFLKKEPIVWLVDEEADIAITKDIVFAGVMFNAMSGYYDYEEFEESFRKKYSPL